MQIGSCLAASHDAAKLCSSVSWVCHKAWHKQVRSWCSHSHQRIGIISIGFKSFMVSNYIEWRIRNCFHCRFSKSSTMWQLCLTYVSVSMCFSHIKTHPNISKQSLVFFPCLFFQISQKLWGFSGGSFSLPKKVQKKFRRPFWSSAPSVQVRRLIGPAEVQRVRLSAQQGPGPGAATVLVRQQLDLVQHRRGPVPWSKCKVKQPGETKKNCRCSTGKVEDQNDYFRKTTLYIEIYMSKYICVYEILS